MSFQVELKLIVRDLLTVAAPYEFLSKQPPFTLTRRSLQKASTPRQCREEALHSFGKLSAWAGLASTRPAATAVASFMDRGPTLCALALAKLLLYCADLIAR